MLDFAMTCILLQHFEGVIMRNFPFLSFLHLYFPSRHVIEFKVVIILEVTKCYNIYPLRTTLRFFNRHISSIKQTTCM